MNIEEFFELSAGKWFSHRSSHSLDVKPSEDGKSNLIIETIAADHPEVIKLCQQYEISPSAAVCAATITWKDPIKSEREKPASTLLACVPDEDNPYEGRLLQAKGNAQQELTIGRYKIGTDEALTITTESAKVHSEERLWFASPNLRMRVSVFKDASGFSMAAFTSEIRMGGGAPAKTTSEVAKSAS
ncbi:phycobiliprotein lyase [Nostoc sp. CENA543]|uniref:phycobiliprotein lyase n=1 Tax=Nostoc sp. CENA543 TaxID=1869241 RepID=UPI000CA28C75|nr:phycobiliprotein lyase [Nostoc sp. CENA543]AUT02796.1 phycobiliprotein lyase [Nostoc sp. CENA543]